MLLAVSPVRPPSAPAPATPLTPLTPRTPPTVADGTGKATRSISEFKPSVHGFKFANAFSGSRLPGGLGRIESALGVPSRYGLCGGMCFAAADFFLARNTIPVAIKPPASGTPLFKYISARQNDSLGANFERAPRFAQWMIRTDAGLFGVRELSLAELSGITDTLDAQRPALLGLVFASRGEKPPGQGGAVWDNHQVLAYAYTRPTPGTWTLRIYDPNYPAADEAMIRCRIAPVSTDLAAPLGGWDVPIFGAVCDRIVPGYRTTRIRGLFQMPYAAEAPPANLIASP